MHFSTILTNQHDFSYIFQQPNNKLDLNPKLNSQLPTSLKPKMISHKKNKIKNPVILTQKNDFNQFKVGIRLINKIQKHFNWDNIRERVYNV
ncbi:hypothetical protein ES319_D10G173400v1 [Gossypium barbadense]|uniref:Uncharacterized protein n=2 Tax=Gossypium TaxID=3633 RepID=A0A5J5PT33_GOSBA|nr:hypothetical protein ES319_D10G173400v1 [Gossypium barbadense]TYG50584.1 hypothetical protein ES288_D10G186200v1 [Gossypium darwinii]